MRVGNVTEAEWTGLVARFKVWFEGKRDPGIALKLGFHDLGGGVHHLL